MARRSAKDLSTGWGGGHLGAALRAAVGGPTLQPRQHRIPPSAIPPRGHTRPRQVVAQLAGPCSHSNTAWWWSHCACNSDQCAVLPSAERAVGVTLEATLRSTAVAASFSGSLFAVDDPVPNQHQD